MSASLAMARNMAIVAFASYTESAVGLLAAIFIARTLGPSEYGHYAYAVWLCGSLVTIANSALTTSSIKFIAEMRGAQRMDLVEILVHKFRRWQAISVVLVLVGFGIYNHFQHMLDGQAYDQRVIWIVVIAVWARAGFWLMGAIGKGHEQFGPENFALMLAAVMNLVITCTLAWLGANLVAFLGCYAFLGVMCNVMVRVLLKRGGVVAKAGDLPQPLFVRLRRHLVLTGIMITFYVLTNRAVEMTLLKKFADSASVAYFAIAGSLSRGVLDLFAGSLSAVLLPSMAKQYGEGGVKALNRMLVESARMYWFIGLIVAGLGLTVADGAIRFFYGERYVLAIPALCWQFLASGLMVVNGAALAALTTDDRQLARVLIVATAFVFNVVVGYVLIPTYGLNGAIASSILTQVFSTGLIWFYIFKLTGARLLWGSMGRLLLSALVAGALAAGLTMNVRWPLVFVPGALVFLALYLTFGVRLRVWRASEYDLFAALAGRLGAPGRKLSPWLAGLGQRFGEEQR